MRKIAGFWLGYLCLVLLTACVRKDEPLAPENDAAAEDVGEAELKLPALPPGFLAKASADSVDTLKAYFILTITGPGMTPRRQSWPLGASSTTVRVANIPVGTRLFTGELALGGDVRYADSAWAQIEKGKTAYVHLKLGAATGDAQVCVEIEGLPLPAGCRPPFPRLPDISGCWRLPVGDSLGMDTALMRILQKDSLLQAELVMRDGTRDTARGILNAGRWVSLGLDSTDDFLFSAQLDTMALSMEGKFFRRTGAPRQTVYVRAYRASCGIDTIPVPVDSMTCWDAGQTIGGTGRFLMLERNARVYGLFQWAGYPGMPVSGYKARSQAPLPGAGFLGLYLDGVLPPGLARFSGRPDSVHYKGQLVPEGLPTSVVNGTVNGIVLATGAFGKLGDWKASISRCTVDEQRALLAAHRL